MAQRVKNLPAKQETQEMQIWSQGRENPLEKEMATYSGILAWRIPWTEELGGQQSMGCKNQTWLSNHAFMIFHYVKNIGGL